MSSLKADIDSALVGRHLLDHPFYRRWSLGTLRLEELQDYAAQYRHIERAQPDWLSAIAEHPDVGSARDGVARTLADEVDADATHADLFDRFATAIGAPDSASPSPATRRLLDTVGALVSDGPASGISALLAYEWQSSSISREKASGLRRHFSADDDATAFWDTHAALDQRHSAWLLGALEQCDAPADAVGAAVTAAADAWWAFLDERDSAAGVNQSRAPAQTS